MAEVSATVAPETTETKPKEETKPTESAAATTTTETKTNPTEWMRNLAENKPTTTTEAEAAAAAAPITTTNAATTTVEPEAGSGADLMMSSEEGRKLFKNKGIFNTCVHLINHGGIPKEGVQPVHQHWRVQVASQGTKCSKCGKDVPANTEYYANFSSAIARVWEEGNEKHCEACMAKKLREVLGDDDTKIQQAHDNLHHNCIIA